MRVTRIPTNSPVTHRTLVMTMMTMTLSVLRTLGQVVVEPPRMRRHVVGDIRIIPVIRRLSPRTRGIS